MKNLIIALALLFLFPSLSHAHIMNDDGGFLTGVFHPVLGFDHFLAMLSVGILSAQMGGRAIWTVPLTFVTVMTAGAFIGFNGIELPAVELGISLSVVALGISLALEKKLLTIWAMLFVGFFALFHGHAHGTEMPKIVQPAVYASGFILGTAGIHLAGVSIGLISCRTVKGGELLRFLGAGISGVGVHILYILYKFRY